MIKICTSLKNYQRGPYMYYLYMVGAELLRPLASDPRVLSSKPQPCQNNTESVDSAHHSFERANRMAKRYAHSILSCVACV